MRLVPVKQGSGEGANEFYSVTATGAEHRSDRGLILMKRFNVTGVCVPGKHYGRYKR